MDYIENNYAPILVVILGYASKKLIKKDLVPVSTWGQMFTTYSTVLSAVIVSSALKRKIDENKIKPKPN